MQPLTYTELHAVLGSAWLLHDVSWRPAPFAAAEMIRATTVRCDSHSRGYSHSTDCDCIMCMDGDE